MSQVCFSLLSLFLPVGSCRSSRAVPVPILPSALLVERFLLGAWWVLPIQILFPLEMEGARNRKAAVRCRERLGGLLKYCEREAA
jgi:hypothetical protein